jgi:hypothetical protein
VLDLGAAHDVRGVTVAVHWHYPELAERMAVESSDDGVTWQPWWLGWTGGLAMDGALEDPRLTPLRITLPPVRTRYLRLWPAPEWRGVEVKVIG